MAEHILVWFVETDTHYNFDIKDITITKSIYFPYWNRFQRHSRIPLNGKALWDHLDVQIHFHRVTEYLNVS